MNFIQSTFNPDAIQNFLLHNPEYAWLAVFTLAFLESMVITGSIVPSIVLFSICVYLFDQQILALYLIALIAMIGAHLGDLGGFLVGKYSGEKVLSITFFQKRTALIRLPRDRGKIIREQMTPVPPISIPSKVKKAAILLQ